MTFTPTDIQYVRSIVQGFERQCGHYMVDRITMAKDALYRPINGVFNVIFVLGRRAFLPAMMWKDAMHVLGDKRND